MTDPPPESPPVILYEHGPCFVFNKPSGLLTQAPPGIPCLERQVRAFLTQRDQPTHPLYLGTIHRLDRPVSGAIVMATRVRATQKIARQFERRTVDKRYWAIVQGHVEPAAGQWTDFIRKIPNVARAEIASASTPDAREATLDYQTLGRVPGGTWLEIRLHTGRMHQIRIQAASRGHPVWGDAQYGSTERLGPPQEDPRLEPIALHARQLAFDDPSTRQRVTILAPLPATWSPWSLEPFEG